MRTSKTAIFHKKGQPLTFENVPVPDLTKGQVLVKIEYTTLCRSDLNTYTGKRIEKEPTILGHEIVGRIAAFGPEAPAVDARRSRLYIGDRVTWSIYASDPDSPLAIAGMPQKGSNLFKYGHERVSPEDNLHGGLSEFCILRRNTAIIKVDEAVPLPLVALINCSVATVAGAIRLANDIRGKVILISGVGMLGIVACAMCRSLGASKIIALDINESRLETAGAFGAHEGYTLSEAEAMLSDRLEAIEFCIDFSGKPETMERTLDLLGTGGTAVWVGATFPQRDLCINAEKVVRKIQTIKGLHNYNEDDLITAVSFMEEYFDTFPFIGLVHDHYQLECAEEAFAYALESNVHRVGIHISKDDK